MLLASIHKDILLLVRDRGAVMSLFLLPVVFIAVFGTVFGGRDGPDPVRLAIWHAPDDARGARIAAALEATGQFRIERAASADAARAAAAADDLVGLVIPPDLAPVEGRRAELLLDDAAPPQVRGPIEGAIAATIARELLGAPPPGYERLVDVRGPPGAREALPDVSSFQVSVPGNAVLFGFFLALQVALSFVEERRTGTWRRLLASPANRRLLLAAKLVPYLIVGLVQFVFLFGIGWAVFDMQVAGSPFALVVLTVATVACATALGLAIAALGGTEKQVGGIGSICLLVMGLAGGAMVPRIVMPEVMRTLSLGTPHAWALDGYFDVLVRSGTTVVEIAPQLAALAAFTAAFLAFGALVFRFEK